MVACSGSEERISNGSVAALTAGDMPDKSSRSPDKQIPFPDSSPDISKVSHPFSCQIGSIPEISPCLTFLKTYLRRAIPLSWQVDSCPEIYASLTILLTYLRWFIPFSWQIDSCPEISPCPISTFSQDLPVSKLRPHSRPAVFPSLISPSEFIYSIPICCDMNPHSLTHRLKFCLPSWNAYLDPVHWFSRASSSFSGNKILSQE